MGEQMHFLVKLSHTSEKMCEHSVDVPVPPSGREGEMRVYLECFQKRVFGEVEHEVDCFKSKANVDSR